MIIFIKGKELIIPFRLRILGLILAILGLILSGSLTGLVGLFISFFTYYLLFKTKKLIKPIILTVIFSLGLYLIFQDVIDLIIQRQKLDESLIPSSLKARINGVWLESYLKFIESPLLGIGPSVNNLKYSVDNEFLDKFLRYGIIGGVSFILFFPILLIHIWKLIKKSPFEKKE